MNGNAHTSSHDMSAPSSVPDRNNDGVMESTEAIEWHAPVLVKIDPHMTIPYLLKRRVERSPHRTLIEIKGALGDQWHPITAAEFYEEVQATASGLIAMGLEAGDSVAIMSRTRYEWTLLDYACWCAGLVPVPIYETSSPTQVGFILTDTNIKFAIAETSALEKLIRHSAQEAGILDIKVLSLESDAIATIQAAASTSSRRELARRTDSLTVDSLATIVYTSGTTGTPKGAVITHRNFTDLTLNSHQWMPEVANHEGSRLLLFLPLSHAFARLLEVFQLSGAGVMGHVSDTKNLLPDLASFRPSYLLAVPRVLEKIYNSADAKAVGPRRKIFRWAARTAVQYSQALDSPQGPSQSLKSRHALADKLVYQKITELLGGNADFIISGGAPLSVRLSHFYRGLGLPVLEGYGLTETVGPISVNTPHLVKIGTVGPILPPNVVKISDDGEILVKGASLFQGYHHLPEETAAAFTEDGWFRTGDLGSIDRDGYLRINGRSKDMLVTAGGKNVAPAPLEDSLREHPLIGEVIVVGDRKPFIAALITLDAEMLPLWLRNHGLRSMSATEAASNEKVLEALEQAVKRVNSRVSQAESIRKFKVLTEEFSEDNGLLTPSLKVRRQLVHQRFTQQIVDLYSNK